MGIAWPQQAQADQAFAAKEVGLVAEDLPAVALEVPEVTGTDIAKDGTGFATERQAEAGLQLRMVFQGDQILGPGIDLAMIGGDQ